MHTVLRLLFLVQIAICKGWFLRREKGKGGKGVPGARRKLLGAKETTNNKLNPHLASTPGFEPRLL